jgi:hypothetical protein
MTYHDVNNPLLPFKEPLYYSTTTQYDAMADTSYAAADERARDARRAGLQAKKDEQPANTARSYRSKQEEWKARGSTPLYLPPFNRGRVG